MGTNTILAALAFILILAVVLAFFWLVVLKLMSRLAARLGHSSPCPASLSWLVHNPIRRRYTRPILDRVGIRPGERVLELGPGPGAFTVDAARRVGPEGRLVVVDIQPEMIAQVERRVRAAELDNVETHVAGAYDLPLDDASVDRAFLITVLPEIPDRARALAELRRVLKPGGVLSITEEFLDPDYLFAFETVRLVEAAGFRLMRRMGNLWLYTLNFESFRQSEARKDKCMQKYFDYFQLAGRSYLEVLIADCGFEMLKDLEFLVGVDRTERREPFLAFITRQTDTRRRGDVKAKD